MIDVKELTHNYVLAVVDGSDSAATAVVALELAGFPDARVLDGNELQQLTGASDEKSGNFLSNALKSIPEHLSEESDYLVQYQEEARKGSSIIAAMTGSGAPAQKAQYVLERFGGRNVRFFGLFLVSDLSASSNPSAQEDVGPSHSTPEAESNRDKVTATGA